MSYIGDFAEDSTVRITFNTNKADGTPYSLADSPAVAVYKSGSTTESTAGVTPSFNYDSRTGLHVIVIDTSADAFYATANDYDVVFTAGTVDSISVVGVRVGSFSIENRPTTSAPSAAAVADAVWDEALADHTTAGSAGKGVADSASAGDPWSTALPGAYTAGQAGYIIGNQLDAAVSTRSSHTAANVATAILVTPANKLATDASGYITVGTNNDKSGYALTVTPPTAAQNADAVWDEVLSGHVTAGTAGLALGSMDADAIALGVWDVLFSDIVTEDSMGAFLKGKISLITSQGVVRVTIVESGDVIDIYKGRSRTITFIIAQASIDLTDHTPKFGMTKIAGDGDTSLEVAGTLTEVGDDYHLTFELSTDNTDTLAKSPTVVNPYQVDASNAYSYHWSISATDDANSCPQLAEGYVDVKDSDTTCTVPE